MKHPLQSYITDAYKSCQIQNELNILINIVQKYHMQQCITRIPVPIVPTEKENFNKHTNIEDVDNSCFLQ